MKYKTFSRDELTDLLTNGIPLPDSAKTDENTIDFYFEELESFINLAENRFSAKSTEYLEITIEVDFMDFIILRYVSGSVFLYLVNSRPNIISDMTTQEASDVIGIVYGVTIYNEKWVQINELVDEFTDELVNKYEYEATKEKINIDPKLLAKHSKSPNRSSNKVIDMKDFDKYIKKDTKKIYK
jgi:hypothetical protein